MAEDQARRAPKKARRSSFADLLQDIAAAPTAYNDENTSLQAKTVEENSNPIELENERWTKLLATYEESLAKAIQIGNVESSRVHEITEDQRNSLREKHGKLLRTNQPEKVSQFAERTARRLDRVLKLFHSIQQISKH